MAERGIDWKPFLIEDWASGVPDGIESVFEHLNACGGDEYAWREARRRQSSARICVEHTNAELRQWAPLRRFTGRRETFPETQQAIAALISDRAAKRATRREHSTELVLVRTMAC